MSRVGRVITGLGALAVAGLISEWAWRQVMRSNGTTSRLRNDSPFLVLSDDVNDQGVLGLIDQLRFHRGSRAVLLLHTFGGDLSDVSRLARAVEVHGNVEAWVPYRALSGGTIVALAARKIVLWPDACLGPVDPQLCMGWSGFSSHSLDNVVATKGPEAGEIWVATAHEGRRAYRDVQALLSRYNVPEKALARLLNANNTHAFPIFLDEARELGLPVEAPPQNLDILDSQGLSQLLQAGGVR